MEFSVSQSTPIWALVGPTAVGKTAQAMRLAEAVGGEIIACDSVQVYRGFDIGSAKPTAAEQARVPHHIVDVVQPHEAFDAQRFVTLARAAMADMQHRGRVPIVCGGTGLYLRALRYGLVQAAQADPALRATLQAEEQADPGSLYRRLQSLDPVSAQHIDARNGVHVMRALEICLTSGRRASVVRQEHGFAQALLPMRVVVLQRDAVTLKARITERVRDMLQHGLVSEVETLLQRGVSADCRPMRAVGYREVVDVLLERAEVAGLAERIVASTWAYARRQRTWMRRETDVLFWDAARDAAELLRIFTETS